MKDRICCACGASRPSTGTSAACVQADIQRTVDAGEIRLSKSPPRCDATSSGNGRGSVEANPSQPLSRTLGHATPARGWRSAAAWCALRRPLLAAYCNAGSLKRVELERLSCVEVAQGGSPGPAVVVTFDVADFETVAVVMHPWRRRRYSEQTRAALRERLDRIRPRPRRRELPTTPPGSRQGKPPGLVQLGDFGSLWRRVTRGRSLTTE